MPCGRWHLNMLGSGDIDYMDPNVSHYSNRLRQDVGRRSSPQLRVHDPRVRLQWTHLSLGR